MRSKFTTDIFLAFSILFTISWNCHAQTQVDIPEKPNIIFILADDLGYNDLSCYGQTKFETPNIDKMAANGLRFTQAYAGSAVCGPSRSVLQTGLNTGHTRIRGNVAHKGGIREGGRRRVNLTAEDVTVGHVMQKAGYRTCLVGKWHVGGYSYDGAPWNQGYDEFFGWLIKTVGQHKPTYFPKKYYENKNLFAVEGNQNGAKEAYVETLNTDYAVKFLERSKGEPFMLMLNYMVPHSPYDVPNVEQFEDQSKWNQHQKIYAQMVANLDTQVGRIMESLDKLGLTKNTLVILSSDNGPRSEPQAYQTKTVDFFDSNGELRGYKRDVYEGGIRVPMIAHWPGYVPAGKTSEALWNFADIMPTFAELGGGSTPENIDGISVVEALLDHTKRYDNRFQYWEFYEQRGYGFKQAVRWGKWKGIRVGWEGPILLFDMTEDISEANNVAADHPEVVDTIKDYLSTARTESPHWPNSWLKSLK